MTYRLLGSESARLVFYVDPTSGLVSLKKPLAETADQAFTVDALVTSHTACASYHIHENKLLSLKPLSQPRGSMTSSSCCS